MFGFKNDLTPMTREHIPNVQLLPEENSNGEVYTVPKDIDILDNPLVGLSYSDFSIKNLLANGVDLRSLPIQADSRLGVDDSEIDAFFDRVDKIHDRLFIANSDNAD